MCKIGRKCKDARGYARMCVDTHAGYARVCKDVHAVQTRRDRDRETGSDRPHLCWQAMDATCPRPVRPHAGTRVRPTATGANCRRRAGATRPRPGNRKRPSAPVPAGDGRGVSAPGAPPRGDPGATDRDRSQDSQGYARISKSDMQGYARICKDAQNLQTGYARVCKDMQAGYARMRENTQG